LLIDHIKYYLRRTSDSFKVLVCNVVFISIFRLIQKNIDKLKRLPKQVKELVSVCLNRSPAPITAGGIFVSLLIQNNVDKL